MSTGVLAPRPLIDDAFLYNVVDGLVGPCFPGEQGFFSAAFDSGQYSSHTDAVVDDGQFFNYGFDDLELAFDRPHGIERHINSHNDQNMIYSVHMPEISDPVHRPFLSSEPAKSLPVCFQAPLPDLPGTSQKVSQQHSNFTCPFLNSDQSATLNVLIDQFRNENEDVRTIPQGEMKYLTELNGSVTLLCDLLDSVLVSYQDGRYQVESTAGRSEANITIMMIFALIARVLKTYRASCQALIISTSSITSSVDKIAISSSARPSPRRKPSDLITAVAQLAVAQYNLRHLSQFFHAVEFVNCVPSIIIESGDRCIQDLHSVISVVMAESTQ